MLKKYINSLDFYGYRESNKMEPAQGKGYKVKVSDKDGNIITIEKDDSLYACVKLAFDSDSGVLSLLDAAHGDSVLAEVEMPNADYIYNCRYDEELNAILFDVKSLYGNETDTIELDVESLVELYEAGQGIEIGEKNEETGRKPISVKLAEGEELLTLTEDGLGLDDKVVTEDELYAAISGKADIEWVEEIISGYSGISEIFEILEEHDDEIEKLKRIVGTDEEIPSLFEQIEDNREDIAQMDDEIGDISGSVSTLEENVESIEDNLFVLSGDIETLKDALNEEIERATSAETDLRSLIEEEAGRAISAETILNDKIDSEEASRKANTISSVDYDSSEKVITFLNANNEIIDSIDATDFVKDGMIDSVTLETVSGTTYLVITWNTDSGKEVTRINIGDIFNADDYYTKAEVDNIAQGLRETDAAIIITNDQQWNAINQNRQDMESVDSQLWDAISNETHNRQDADSDLWGALEREVSLLSSIDRDMQSQINAEKTQREATDTALNSAITSETQARISNDNAISGIMSSKIAEETARAVRAEDILTINLAAEVQRAKSEEQRIENEHDSDVEDLRRTDNEIRQYVNDQDLIINRRIDGLSSELDIERGLRQEKDLELSDEISEIKDNYALITYVDTRDNQVKDESISTSITSAKTYTDNEVDALENSLKEYCDDGHQELLDAISSNTTKINKISNLNTNPDGTYLDNGNGILDVLHREFHYHIEHDGAIEEIIYEDGNIIIIYNTPSGERETIIPASELIDLSNYYTKEEVDYKLDNLDIECGVY